MIQQRPGGPQPPILGASESSTPSELGAGGPPVDLLLGITLVVFAVGFFDSSSPYPMRLNECASIVRGIPHPPIFDFRGTRLEKVRLRWRMKTGTIE